jgi:glycosyltransferase involved in cell wall biosynthesis
LRIVQLIGRLAVGGAERHFVNLLNAFEGHNRHAVLISLPGDGPSLEGDLDRDVRIHRISIRKRRLLADLARLTSLLRSIQPDVVHSHMFWCNLYATIAARLAGVPAVFTTEHGENRWKRPWHRWAEAHIISPLSDQRFCVSQQILESRRDRDGVPESKLRVVANGVPLPDLGRRETSAVPLIGSVGRFVVQKALPDLVEAAAVLRGWGLEFRLVLVGDGPDRAAVEAAVTRFGLEDIVELPGFERNVDDFLKRLSIFASSSIEEGQPLALLEAMAWGLPCVVTGVGAVPRTLTDLSEGRIVPPARPREIAAAIREYLADPLLATRTGLAARRRVERDFSSAAVAARHLEAYEQCLLTKGHAISEATP